jgi:putative transposase
MADYRRWYVPGGTYFFTLATHKRRKFLTDETSRRCLEEAMQTVQNSYAFTIVALVLLPDHLHTVWTLPQGDANYPTRWKRIKEEFTKSYLAKGGIELPVSESRRRKKERGVWQRRYWEHTVRDEDDLKRCVDYTHWNPKKHGYVKRVRDWEYSTFHEFVRLGEYDIDWGAADPTPGHEDPEWGE